MADGDDEAAPGEPVVVYTDGACSGNPGPGGWAWITEDGRCDSGGEADTTNQRMELKAVLEALGSLPGPLEVRSDSTYVVNCFRDRWFEGWLARGWKNAARKPVANRDLWEPLIALYRPRAGSISFTWVKGHSGDRLNDAADALAVAAAEANRPGRGSAAGDVPGPTAASVPPSSPPWPVDRGVWVVGAVELDADQRADLHRAVDALDPRRDILISGLRRGAELEAAERARRNGVPVAVVLPFADPAGAWPLRDRERFDAALDAAEWTVVLGGDPARPGDAVAARNDWLAGQVVGAIVIGDPDLARRLDEGGIGVIS